ncbi:DEAD/DEAH box helicase [Gordonia liuliyuniae]|uniref:DEAD/DEAH box helicase n=1 Tax=Gordonia liuliyuniae TaxID=2911517 RepID=A0ABS9IWH1_9ACTN|nr:DEAD/DEAH box helicase [Gordonia liuliyuniae]MCF8589912.1 DEAD/DEAH box helicase [Gordonia liuliyuniae]
MDRALRPEFVAEALGEHAEEILLPTVEQLIELIAAVEVGAFAGMDDTDEQLLETAWYLHGVASASLAAELYTAARQQRAFAVSAHIFDLALNTSNLGLMDRLNYAFAAQVGYRRADLDPNATAIWRRVDADLDDSPPQGPNAGEAQSVPTRETSDDGADRSGEDTEPDTEAITSGIGLPRGSAFSLMALRAGIAFLGLDIGRISELLTTWRANVENVREIMGTDSLVPTMFGPAEQVVLAIEDLVDYLRYGQGTRLETARAALQSVVDLSAGEGDADSRWVAAHLLTIADGLEDSSIWSVLPPDSPPELAQAFTIGTPPVLTLWPPQRELLRRTELNPLDPATTRLLLSVPTSAGKTLLAQIIMCHHLATASGDVCYVSPLRSLGREMRQALSSRLRILHKSLGDDLPDFGSMNLNDLLAFFSETTSAASVEIMTPERLSHLLRRDPDGVLGRFTMFVIDEAHLVAEPHRGFLLESILSVLGTSDARLVLLSAVMGNAQQVASWLDDSSPNTLFSSDWRGPRRLHSVLNSEIVWDSARELKTRSVVYPVRKEFDVIGKLRIKPAEAATKILWTDRERPLGVRQLEYPAGRGKPRVGKSTAFYKICAKTACAFLPAGSLLMIVTRRDFARNAATVMAAGLPISNRTGKLIGFLVERLGVEHPLIECVRYGIGYHHAGLPVDVLDALEQAIRSENLLALVATSTLTDGVNLPVRTVLIAETSYPTQDKSQHYDAARLLNAVGRAGRAGRETEGWIILALQQESKASDFDKLRPAVDDLLIESTLTSDEALETLEEAEALLASSADELFTLADSAAASFASFVWFVLSAHQRLEELATSNNIIASVKRLLAFDQMSPELAARWIAFAQRITGIYEHTPADSRHRWAIAGTSLGSARELERLAMRVADLVATTYSDPTDDGRARVLTLREALNVLDEVAVFDTLLALPESGKVWTFKKTPAKRETLEIEVAPFLQGWLEGLDTPSLAAATQPMVSDAAWRLEQTVDAISGAIEHFFSWTIGVLVEQANGILSEADAPIRLPEDLPLMIRYGVDTPQAVAILSRGVRSRRLAHAVGRKAAGMGLQLDETITWLRMLHISGWVDEFDATPREIEDLADLTRDVSATSLLRQLLSSAEATANLHQPMDPYPLSEIPVSLRADRAAEPIEVWTVGEASYRIGLVAAEHHADYIALVKAGLSFSVRTEGGVLTIRTDS